jgi:hypothetical protein
MAALKPTSRLPLDANAYALIPMAGVAFGMQLPGEQATPNFGRGAVPAAADGALVNAPRPQA